MAILKKALFHISRIPEKSEYLLRRRKYDLFLRDHFLKTEGDENLKVTVDGSFDNPNFWYRTHLILGALKIPVKNISGFIAEYRRDHQARTFRRMGVSRVHDFHPKRRSKPHPEVSKILPLIQDDQKFLDFKFSRNFPAKILYDFILKRQKGASVDFSDPKFEGYLHDIYNTLDEAEELFKSDQPDLFVSSHAIGWHAAVVWIALQQKIKVIVPFGDNGLQKFWHLKSQDEIYDFMDCLKPHHFEKFSLVVANDLERMGEAAIKERVDGTSRNIGSVYAYKKRTLEADKEEICRHYGWDVTKPIVAVYASNWFDFPHSFGMNNFRQFFDWISLTIEEARSNRNVNWLFKGHPVDDWYGGITLESLIAFGEDRHIALADKRWNGLALMRACDGIISCHGTIGVEAPIFRTPVLVADLGWYDQLGFVLRSPDRETYRLKLRQEWWKEIDKENARSLALKFGGGYWGRCPWQKGLIFGDDSEGPKLLEENIQIIKSNSSELETEFKMLSSWFHSGESHFNTYKILQTLS